MLSFHIMLMPFCRVLLAVLCQRSSAGCAEAIIYGIRLATDRTLIEDITTTSTIAHLCVIWMLAVKTGIEQVKTAI